MRKSPSPRLVKEDFIYWLKHDRLDVGFDEEITGMFEDFLQCYFFKIHGEDDYNLQVEYKKNGIFKVVFGWQDCIEEFEIRVPSWMRDMIISPPKFYIAMEE